ncbi:MAG: sulfur carrier protein ThiS [Bacteroidales bacterium]|jgi:sulfur carrier protein|nr:sulfur carrier protein ThiS [Bacteroidales bacterium]
MTIKLNDCYYEVEEGTSLAVFIQNIGLKPDGIAVAVNFEVVPKNKWAETFLSDRMELMLIHAVSGG